ncbi:MAG: C13 family peptidase [Reyranellales bacterium]
MLLVAGDGSALAFDNGVNTLRERLAARGMRDVEVLSSDPASAAKLASPLNLYGALGTKRVDACLVYLTSHGTPDGLYMNAGRCFLGAAALDQALTEGCGSAPTVLVVSACHSGVFLTPEMRKPNRAILTAAAADRASFGCSAEDEYTYYDQCFLQQLDGATTWRELALATKSCVESLERRLGVRRPSNPQAFFGEAVSDLRIPGR